MNIVSQIILLALFLCLNLPGISLAKDIELKPFQTKIYASDGGDHIGIELTSRVQIQQLLGEPIVACQAKWTLRYIEVNGRRDINLPKTVVDEVLINNLKIIYQVSDQFGGIASFNGVPCDPGHLNASGMNQWSYTVPASPSWERSVISLSNTFNTSLKTQFKNYKNNQIKYLDDAAAKRIFKSILSEADENGSTPLSLTDWVKDSAVMSGEANLWPVYHYLKQLEYREADSKNKQATAQQSQINDKSLLADYDPFSEENFDAELTSVENKRNLERQVSSISSDIENHQNKNRIFTQINEGKRQEVLANAFCLNEADINLNGSLSAFMKANQKCISSWKNLERFEEDDKYGYRSNNRIIISPQYVDATNFYKGSAFVKNCEYCNWSAINSQGRVLHELDSNLSVVGGISKSGLTLVQSKKNQKYGYINSEGDIVISARYEKASSFDKQHRAIVRKDKMDHLIDPEGKHLHSEKSIMQSKEDPVFYVTTKTISYKSATCNRGSEGTSRKRNIDKNGQQVGSSWTKDFWGEPKFCLRGY